MSSKLAQKISSPVYAKYAAKLTQKAKFLARQKSIDQQLAKTLIEHKKTISNRLLPLIPKYQMNKPIHKILDCGSGFGETTMELSKMFPKSKVLGIESNFVMAEESAEQYEDEPNVEFKNMSINSVTEKFDVVVSTSTLHTMKYHDKLIPKMLDLVNSGGVFGFYVPRRENLRFYELVKRVANEKPFKEALNGWTIKFNVLDIGEYAKLMYPRCGKDMEIVEYADIMEFDNTDVLMKYLKMMYIKSYEQQLPVELREKFERRCAVRVYEECEEGKIAYVDRSLYAIGKCK